MATKAKMKKSELPQFRVVRIEEARAMSKEGYLYENSRYDPTSFHIDEPPQYFMGKYSILWRPDPNVPESEQYCHVSEVGI